VRRASIPADTDPEAFGVLVDCWRSMTVADRVALVEQVNADVEMLAIAGIRSMRPDVDEHELLHALASRRFGAAIADDAYRHLRVE
jgi:hypothetical protein